MVQDDIGCQVAVICWVHGISVDLVVVIFVSWGVHSMVMKGITPQGDEDDDDDEGNELTRPEGGQKDLGVRLSFGSVDFLFLLRLVWPFWP